MKNTLVVTLAAISLTGCSVFNLPLFSKTSAAEEQSAKQPSTQQSTLTSFAMPMRETADMKKSKDEAKKEEEEVKPSKNEAVVEPMDEAPEAREERRQMEEEKAEAAEKKRNR
ncbi:MAG: hypothetical protein V3V30_05835 [Parvularculaceae bacterium]